MEVLVYTNSSLAQHGSCLVLVPSADLRALCCVSTEMQPAAGFMSNRGRQNVASYLILDLGIDWRKGADWFESVLTDYDVASNWGNWVSAAGMTGGRINHFNTLKQSKVGPVAVLHPFTHNETRTRQADSSIACLLGSSRLRAGTSR